MLTSDNGILTQAQNAKEETEIASEKEAIQLTMINRETTNNSKYDIGEELRDRTLANGDNWKIVSVNETKKIYGTGYYYVGKGTSLENYGETKYEWIINYNTGEIEKLPEEGYIKLAYGDNLAVTDGIILNVDPINMGDSNSWGEGVTVYGIQERDGYGWNETEFKLDGVDDYIEVYPQQNINVENGLTFEFYAKSNEDYIDMLGKTLKGNTDDSVYTNKFRTQIRNYHDFYCCMSDNKCESDWVDNVETASHWIKKKDIGTLNTEDGGYLTMTADIDNNVISLYWNGNYIDSTTCSNIWMTGGGLTDYNIPFTIGFNVSGINNKYTEKYSKVDIYACRLYNKVLTLDEVKANYDKTVAYHNVLIQSQKEDGEN